MANVGDVAANGAGSFGYSDDENNHCCGRQWCVTDACGISCAIFTWILMFYGQFCVLAIMMTSVAAYPVHQIANLLVFECLFVLAFLSHVKTMLTNPGTVPKGTLMKEQIDEYKAAMVSAGDHKFVTYRCTKCSCVKPQRAHHCSVCQRCIRRMDHHCPWVNNCVGENNQKNFVLFTLYISLVSCHALYWTAWQFVLCINEDWNACSAFSPPTTTVMLMVLLFESILFSIFTAVMFGTQLSAICSDQTGIESIKRETFNDDDDDEKGNGGSKSHKSWKYLQAVFGGPLSFQWFNPLAAPFVSQKAFEFSV